MSVSVSPAVSEVSSHKGLRMSAGAGAARVFKQSVQAAVASSANAAANRSKSDYWSSVKTCNKQPGPDRADLDLNWRSATSTTSNQSPVNNQAATSVAAQATSTSATTVTSTSATSEKRNPPRADLDTNWRDRKSKENTPNWSESNKKDQNDNGKKFLRLTVSVYLMRVCSQ
jgi:hypothetical protein